MSNKPGAGPAPKAELSAQLIELMAQGKQLVLVALSDRLPHADAGWPVRMDKERQFAGRVLAIVADKRPESEEAVLDKDLARKKSDGLRRCSQKRRPTTKRRGGALASANRRGDLEMEMSLRVMPAHGAGDGVAFTVFIAYKFRGGLKVFIKRRLKRIRGNGRGANSAPLRGKRSKPFRVIQPMFREQIKRRRAMRSITRQSNRRDAMGGGSWNRSLNACEAALRERHAHAQRLGVPSEAQLAQWAQRGGLGVAAAYFQAQAQARALLGVANEAAPPANAGEGSENGESGGGGAKTRRAPRL